VLPVLDAAEAVLHAAADVRAVNEALGTSMTPAQVAREIPAEAIPILAEWVKPKKE